MLITFRCEAHASITMFGDIALRFIKLMGHSETVPGAILAEDVPAALESLITAMKAEPEEPEEGKKNPWDDRRVSIPTRALPLIDLLKAAEKEQCNVMWDQARPTEPGISF